MTDDEEGAPALGSGRLTVALEPNDSRGRDVDWSLSVREQERQTEIKSSEC